ncbi:MAG TPA: NlpC/P60 family protein [Candidatus Acidoferrales bacterium]|jgi:cell wall-associated NlpC family hydrolase
MKPIKYILKILSLLLLVFGSGSLGHAMESPKVTQESQPGVAQTNLLQLGAQLQTTSFDCSHLVHSLYNRVGLHYPYATSRALYQGVDEFQRVLEPISGDVVVWRGHMGIVVDPAKHSFLSALRMHVKISSYISNYWKLRGTPRFFRFAAPVEKPNQ